jgi:iron complex transport system ATP-binding protein
VTPVLAAQDISYRVGTSTLIDNVTLSLTPGRVLALVGPNGAGKSTLLRLLAGDLQPTAGSIAIDGHPLRSYSALQLARLRAVMPQHALVNFAFQVDQVVAMGRYPHLARRDISPDEDEQIVRQALASADMEAFRTRTYPTLSGGEASRTLLARALAQETGVLLLDEPTASLDIGHQEMVMNLSRTLAARGKALLVILHDLNLAAAHADEIALLHRGRLAALGSPAETLTAPLLSEIYGCPIYVTTHPRRRCLLVLADGT